MAQFLCLVKLKYVPLSLDDEEVLPDNIEAIQYGLEALNNFDSKDTVREDRNWQKAYEALAAQSEDETGAGAIGSVMVEDTFSMREISCDYRGGWSWP